MRELTAILGVRTGPEPQKEGSGGGGGCTRAKGAQAEWAWGPVGAGSRGSGRNPAVEAAGANQTWAHTNLTGHLEWREWHLRGMLKIEQENKKDGRKVLTG